MRKKITEHAAQITINMMRSMANQKPISPFHLNAADEMQSLLDEVKAYRAANKKPKEKK
jgi:hypothetical protein